MTTIEIRERIIILAHVVSFALEDKFVGDGETVPAVVIYLTSGEHIAVVGNDLERVHSQLREAFNLR